MPTAFVNGKIVTENEILENHVLLIEGSAIVGIVPAQERDRFAPASEVDLRGQYIAPGFIDIHSDSIEHIIQPRPTAMMDFEMALKEGEKQYISAGITTMYHSLSLYKDDFFGNLTVRKAHNVKALAALISNLHLRRHVIHHRFHARFEIDNVECLSDLMELIEQGSVHELSIMDHTPGQGQYRDLEVYRKQLDGYAKRKMTDDEWQMVMDRHNAKARITSEQLIELVQTAKHHGISIASHDDDTEEKIAFVHDLGVQISEFPITIDVAKAARAQGMMTVAGAPNVLLGGSHTGNLSAAQAVLEGCIDVLCSDYYPSALLYSVFALHNQHGVPLHKAFNLVTANAAKAVGIDDQYGSIAPGKMADLLVIDIIDGYPAITQALIHGKWALRLEYRV